MKKNLQSFLKAVNNYTKFLSFVTALLLQNAVSAQIGWTEVPTPNPSAYRNILRGISGTSSSDVWVVGEYQTSPPMSQFYGKNLAMHWNGTTWQTFNVPNRGVTLDDLYDVEMVSTTEGWAGGTYDGAGSGAIAQLHKWNGSAWSIHPVPNGADVLSLDDIDAVSSSDIWGVGRKGIASNRAAYSMHYNGTSWSEVTVPPVGTFRTILVKVDALSANDAWAAGNFGNAYGDFHAVVMHWNGSAWVNSPIPSNISGPMGQMLSVKMVNTNDVWAAGYYLAGGMFMIHWNGTVWTDVPAVGGGGDFAIIDSNNIWSVGGEFTHWDGNSWTKTDSMPNQFDPSLGCTVVFPNGNIWAAGRTVDSLNNFFNLVYRSISNIATFARGSAQPWEVLINTANNSLDSLLETNDIDVRQILKYTLAQAPQHGTITGLPASAITNNGKAYPTGVNYTPFAGYVGMDSFTVKVSIGAFQSSTTIYTNVQNSLPVTLAGFNVRAADDGVLVSWITSSENNSKAFEVLHSTNGRTFSILGTITAAGNSTALSRYSYFDKNPTVGINYYRLKQIDKDNFSVLYEIKSISIKRKENFSLSIYANPVKGQVVNANLIADEGTYVIKVYGQNGQCILSKTIKYSPVNSLIKIQLPVSVISGTYHLRVEGGGRNISKSFIVEN